MHTRMNPVYTAALWALLLGGAVGCSPEITGYCENLISCERGNEYDEEACVEYYEAEEDVADVYGCKSAYEGLLQCRNDFSVCMPANSSYELSVEEEYSSESEGSGTGTSGGVTVEPGVYTVPNNSCSAAYDVYTACMDAVNAQW